jgi:hypothetical protein
MIGGAAFAFALKGTTTDWTFQLRMTASASIFLNEEETGPRDVSF